MIDLTKVGYTSLYNTEKIVKVFDGSFLYGTDTTTRDFGLSLAQIYPINHGFTRPVFTELWWSLNDQDYYVGAGYTDANSAAFLLSYSDATNVYVLNIGNFSPISNGTRIYYKIVCGWINDYDDTDPLIPAFTDFPPNYKRNFQSKYQTSMIAKEGKITLTTDSGSFTNVIQSQPHGLDYTPILKCYFNAFPGEVWPLNYGGLRNPYLLDVSNQVEALAFVDDTKVTANAVMKSGSGEVNFWYMLYTPVDNLQTIVSTGADIGI